MDGGDGEGGGGMESVGNGKKSVLRRGERCTQNVLKMYVLFYG